MKEFKQFKLSLSPEELEHLTEISKQLGVSLEEIVKIALEKFLKNPPKKPQKQENPQEK